MTMRLDGTLAGVILSLVQFTFRMTHMQQDKNY